MGKPKKKKVSAETQRKREQTNLERYGVKHPFHTKESRQKAYETKKKNQSFTTSRSERRGVSLLREKGYKVIQQYQVIPDFPIFCDAYLPEINMVIEFHFHWTHGFHPFSETSTFDESKLKRWEKKVESNPQYKKAIDTWTVKDPRRLLKFQEAGVCYAIFYTWKSFVAWYDTLPKYKKKSI